MIKVVYFGTGRAIDHDIIRVCGFNRSILRDN